ncbi:ribosome maturation factor RimM [Magnetospirillum sp. SS-4]|uniref:ribosome maturation factor RimM n=1 Tax=Magnetospirillum sp. SS-4 TaxID=2681465 RepID=UPI00137E8691|nr:ribosome maturation factor RimM [Magnetospirillum sp. SS-4]CAA7623178.1 Ribosome maturation factor RimM [Magnetospirillum sp. SS-4]
MSDRVCVGVVVGVHGVRGAVKVKSFTEVPTDIGYYSPVEDETGSRKIRLKVTGEAKGVVIAALDGIGDRDAAEALRGTKLWVSRERLPRTGEDEFLYSDLIGMAVEGTDGRRLGTVAMVHDFGAGDVLDIALAERGNLMVPFTKAAVPEVDVPGRRLVVVPPLYVADEQDEGSEVPGGRDG